MSNYKAIQVSNDLINHKTRDWTIKAEGIGEDLRMDFSYDFETKMLSYILYYTKGGGPFDKYNTFILDSGEGQGVLESKMFDRALYALEVAEVIPKGTGTHVWKILRGFSAYVAEQTLYATPIRVTQTEALEALKVQ